MTLFEIEWKGPFTIDEIVLLNDSIDCGLYQIYGTHNIMGTDSLMYVGQTRDSFAARLPNRDYIRWDYPEYKIYVGRFGGEDSCSKQDWHRQIDHAEQILIDYCQPPYNSQYLNGLSPSIADDIVILNFGKRHKLPYAVTTAWRQSSHQKGTWMPYCDAELISEDIGNSMNVG